MHKTRAPHLTTGELIDALEAGIASLRARNGDSVSARSEFIAPAVLRAEMERGAVSVVELAGAVGVPCGELHTWMDGGAEIPCWVLNATRIVSLLPPSARRKLLNGSRAGAREHPNRTHPFSRIEEL